MGIYNNHIGCPKGFSVWFAILLMTTITLCSCSKHTKDVSTEHPYSEIIGLKYKTKADFIVYKVKSVSDPLRYSFSSNGTPGFDYSYALTPSYGGVGGPEYVYESYVPPHTTVKINRVTSNRWGLIHYEYIWVELILSKQGKQGEEKVLVAKVLDNYDNSSSSGRIMLNSDNFKLSQGTEP